MRGLFRFAWIALAALALAPATAYAQASIAGVVKDTSGAVLPGVTVEASSTVLIEKTRSVVTDGSGQYKIIDLRPGTYAVTFTLTGFSTVKREGVELSGGQTVSINADLKVGAVEETITVTGETPLVDVQSASVQKVVTKEVVDAIPTGRLAINLAALQPGMILGATSGAGTLSTNANALSSQDVGGTAGDTFTDLSIHGGKASEQRQTINGLSAATVIRFGESLSSSPSFTAMQEVSIDSSGADATLAGGGVRINYIPRDGGNTYKGMMFFSGANSSMQATNYTTGSRDASGVCSPADSLYCRGLLAQPGALVNVYDYNPGFGGPILKDKLWFYGTARWTAAQNQVPNNYLNKNFVAGVTPTNLFNNSTMIYTPDQSQPLQTSYGGGGKFQEQTLRLTWQINSKNKLSAYYNNKVRRYTNAVSTSSWETINNTYFYPFSDQLVQWTSPVTNRLLIEAGVWHHQETWGTSIADTSRVDPLAIGITDFAPSSTTPGYVQLVQNYHGKVGAAYTPSHNPNTRTNFAVSYITGSHAFKAGFDLSYADRGFWNGSIVPYSYVVSTITPGKIGVPVPTGLLLRSDGCQDPLQRIVNGRLTTPTGPYNPDLNCPTFQENSLDLESGAFLQDKWTLNRVTISAGIRFDGFNASQPSYHLGPSLLTPLRNYDVPAYDTVRHKDLTPKMAASWDVFGDGKTAVKVNFSKYVLGEALFGSNPLVTLSNTNVVLTAGSNVTAAGRTWTDNNGNNIPDCDLTNPNLQGPTQTGLNQQVDTCGAVVGANALMYANSPQAQNPGDPNARYGWGVRPYSWEFSLSAQRELTKGVSINGGYFRRWFGNFLVTDDLNHSASDYTAYSVSPGLIPAAPPSSGGQALPGNVYTTGFYNVNNAAAANNFTGLSDQFFPGSNVIDHWNGFDIAINMRLPRGVIFQGGTSTGRQVTDNCDIVDPANAGKFGTRSPLVELLNVAGVANSVSSCHVEQAWLTQIKMLGSYTIPKIDVQLGASYQNIPGIELAATYSALNADIARPVSQGGLGRLPTGAVSATATTNVAIIPPQTDYYQRLSQLDLRFGKLLRFGSTRSNLSLDVYNLFNQATISGASFLYNTQWLAPTAVVAPRLFKASLTFDF
jgi:hypothetical protein